MMSIDASELRSYVAQLHQANAFVQKEVRGVITKGALQIKDDMNAQLAASTHFKGIAGSVTFDIRTVGAFGGGVVEAEIGPDHGRGGALANVAYFGTSRGGGTVEDPQAALDREAPRVQEYLAQIGEAALK